MSDVDIDGNVSLESDRLTVLWKRLLLSIIAILLLSAICFFFSEYILSILLKFYNQSTSHRGSVELLPISGQEIYVLHLKMALLGGIFWGAPVVASLVYIYAAPRFYAQQRRMFFLAAFWALVSFFVGAMFVYGMVFPFSAIFGFDILKAVHVGQTPNEQGLLLIEQLGSIMGLICVFGLVAQVPVLLLVLLREAELNRRASHQEDLSEPALAAEPHGTVLLEVSQNPGTDGKDTA